MLAKREERQCLPQSVREIVVEEFSKATINQQRKIAAECSPTVKLLELRRVAINFFDPKAFVLNLRSSEFYSSWRDTPSRSAWSAAQEYTERLT